VVQTEPATTGEGAPGVAPLGHASPPTEPALPKRVPAHYPWAVLIARIYEVFPLLCPMCGGQMRLISFITEGVLLLLLGSLQVTTSDAKCQGLLIQLGQQRLN
jgi:hypothetical protein